MVVVSLLLLFGDAVAVVSVLAVDVDVDADADAVSGVIPSMGCSVSSAAKKHNFIHIANIIGDYFLRK